MRLFSALSILGTLVLIIASGTVFFRYVEGWSWLDAYFFTVVTLSTVGYGSLVPATAAGKIGTTVMIFLGLSVFVVAVQQFGSFAMKKRQEHTEWLVGHWRHGHDDRSPRDGDKQG
jgi:voltage-gated potassium channel